MKELEEIELISLWHEKYIDKMDYEEFLNQINNGIIKIEYESNEYSINERLMNKANHHISNTHIEEDTLHIDISLGLDNIISEINSHETNHIVIHVDNKDYDELKKLKELNKDIKIIYIDNEWKLQEPITIDEFLDMRKFINETVKEIKEKHLTPVEEIMALYCKLKWYQYNFDENNPDNARYIHSFISTGQIVCAGYSKLFAQIAKELGHNSFVCLINGEDYIDNSEEGHERNAIYIDDDYYGIHGLYYLDITFDSTEYDEIGKKYGEDIQKSNLFFQCFLFTIEDYKYLFPNELRPVTVDNIDKIIPFVQEDFKDFNMNNLLETPKTVDLETIKRIYRNVMLKYRINKDQVEEMIKKFNQHNQIQQMLLEHNGADPKGFRK